MLNYTQQLFRLREGIEGQISDWGEGLYPAPSPLEPPLVYTTDDNHRVHVYTCACVNL